MIRVPEDKEKERLSTRVFEEIMAEYFPNLVKDTNLWIHEAES